MGGNLVYVPYLWRKLRAVYSHPASPVKADASLADYFGVAKSTVHLYIHGTDREPPRDPGWVAKDALRLLVKLLVTIAPGIITERYGDALWRDHSHDRFARTLLESLQKTVSNSLASRPAQLAVAVGLLDRNMRGIIDDSPEVPASATLILPDQGVFFELDSVPGRSLIVLTEDDFGWHCLVPGSRHDGFIRSTRVRVPAKDGRGIFFKSPYCLERFVFIETDAREPLTVRSDPNARGPLSQFECERICSYLTEEGRLGDWRWGDVCVAVSESPTTSSAQSDIAE
jgi:hypothetical protein